MILVLLLFIVAGCSFAQDGVAWRRVDENNFINRISVLESICPCRESKTASCIEDGGDRGEHSYRAYQSDTLDDHFLRDQGKAAGDI